MRIVHVVGARPNFMKAAAVWHALARHEGALQVLLHTGQHYDANMSDVFFADLRLPRPDVDLGVGSGTHARQVAAVLMGFEDYLSGAPRPDIVLVYGDVNSTMAAALVCAKQVVRLGHVEAGLRSFDRTMPEEVNRLVTDQLANVLFTPSEDGDRNLAREGVAGQVHRVGNVMIDTLVRLLPRAKERWDGLAARLGLEEGKPFTLVTLHRASNVDDPGWLREVMAALARVARHSAVVFPVHPRTTARLRGLLLDAGGVRMVEPLGYLDFLALQDRARLVVTDSGGVQEESCSYLGVRCLTLRENTERPITVEQGTNTLVGRDTGRLVEEALRAVAGERAPARPLPLWDGRAGERVADVVMGLASSA